MLPATLGHSTEPMLSGRPAEQRGLAAIKEKIERRLDDPHERDRITRSYMQKSPGVINFDDVCEMFPEYGPNKTKIHHFLDKADVIVWDAFKRYLRNPEIRDVILFAGPPGAGKTSARSRLRHLHQPLGESLAAGTAVLVDRTMGTGAETEEFIKLAHEGKKKTHFIYVHRPPHEAIPGILHRAQTTGRCVRSHKYAEFCVGALRNVDHSIRNHSERVSFGLIENSAGIEEMKYHHGPEAVKEKLFDCARSYGIDDHGDVSALKRVHDNVQTLLISLYKKMNIRKEIIAETSGESVLQELLQEK